MNKYFFIVVLLGAIVACKSKKVVVTTPNGPVEMLTPKMAKEAIVAKQEAPAWIHLKANVSVTQNGSTNNGVVDIRMKQDSIMWVEVADPLLGIKAIRAFAMTDTVAYVNRIEKTYFAGPYAYIEKKLGTGIPFQYIFNVFLGELFIPESEVTNGDGVYILNQKLESGNSFAAKIDPVTLDCVQQLYFTAKDAITISYGRYKMINGFRYPHQINILVQGSQSLTATFELTEVSSGTPLDMPFNISKKYARTY